MSTAIKVPITSEYFLDNFCARLLGFSSPSSNKYENPYSVLPHTVTQSFIILSTLGTYNYQSSPPEILFNITGTGIGGLIDYVFDYPVNLKHLLTSYNSIGNAFYIHVRNNSLTSAINLSFSLEISTENQTTGSYGSFTVDTGSFSIPANTKVFKKFTVLNISGVPDPRRVIMIRLLLAAPAQGTSFSIMHLGYIRYPVFGEISSDTRLLLFDNFTLPQFVSSGSNTIQTDGSFYYVRPSPTPPDRVLTVSASSGSISIFQNFSTTVSNSPAMASIAGTFNGLNDFFSITYPQNSLLKNGDRGTLIYALNTASQSLIIEVLFKLGSVEYVIGSRTENSTLQQQVQFFNFTNNLSTNLSNYDVVVRVRPATSGTTTFDLQILHFSIVDSSHILPDPSPTFNYFSDTFTHVLTGNTFSLGTPFIPIGTLPAVGIKKTYLINNPINGEDGYSYYHNNMSLINNPTNIIAYNFSPTADFSALRKFNVLFAVTGNVTGLVLTFEIDLIDSSNNVKTFSATTSLLNSSDTNIVKRIDLSPTSILNLASILKDVSTMIVRVDQTTLSDNTNGLRIFSIKGEYSNRDIVFYDNFTSKQSGGTMISIEDNSLNYPGRPQRLLKQSTAVTSSCYDMFGVDFTTKSPTDRYLKIVFNASSVDSVKVLYPDKNLLSDFKYNILVHVLLPSGYNVVNPTITIKDETKGTTLHTQNITFTNGQSIIFVDPPVSEDISFEITGSSGILPATMLIGSIFFEASEATCVLEGSKVLMADGTLKNIEQVQRGDLVLTAHGPLPVSRLIEEKLGEKVYLIKIPKGCIDGTIPLSDLYVCSGHVVKHLGKRRYASTLLCYDGVTTLRGRTQDITDKKAMYDLQFDIETFYYVEGLESQSRSPYCHYSPLPKELYFNKELWKNIRVPNALMDEAEDINNFWPNIKNKFCWRTYLAKYIIETQDTSITPKDFNEETALRLSKKKQVDLSEIIPEDFHWENYIKLNDDLSERLRRTEMDACLHWVRYGYREKRRYK